MQSLAALKPLFALDAPLAPVHPIRDLLAHLTTTPVHATYFPFLRFGCLHATRTAIAWAAMTRARGSRPSTLVDLLGYLTISCGGGTIVSILLSTPPIWLLSPLPWGIYVSAYVLLVETGVANIISQAPALPLSLALSLVDGLCRGVAITSMPALASKVSSSWITPVILGAIATCGGGWIAEGMGMNKSTWQAGIPRVLSGGVLPTLDVWGAMAAGFLYVTLTQGYPALKTVGKFTTALLPGEYVHDGRVSGEVARALVVLFLTALFAARAITQLAVARRGARRAAVPVPVPVPVTSVQPKPTAHDDTAPSSPTPPTRKRKSKAKSKSPSA